MRQKSQQYFVMRNLPFLKSVLRIKIDGIRVYRHVFNARKNISRIAFPLAPYAKLALMLAYEIF